MHRFLCVIILASLIAITAGCGGGGGGSSSPNTPDPSVLTVEISPQSITLPANGHCGFHATLTNATNSAVTWSVVEEIDGGLITTAGNYIAPSTEGLTCHVRATSVQDPSKSAVAMVSVSGAGVPPGGNNGVEVGISPAEVFLPTGTEMQFFATVTGHSNTSVTWSLSPSGSASGTIAQDGTFTSPTNSATVYVTATSNADPTKSATATVLVIPGGLPPIPGF